MTYYIVKVKEGKAANLSFMDENIYTVSGGNEYLVVGGSNFERAKRDNIFEDVRVATNKDFESMSSPLQAINEFEQLSNKGKK